DEIPDPVKVSLVVHHQALLRNKRCLLAYLKWRADRWGKVDPANTQVAESNLAMITQLRWETGPVIPQELQQSLSARERDLFNAYDGILTNYAEGLNLDLTADLQPPKELHVEVRVLSDCGEIMTDHLERGTTHLLRRSDVEHLVLHGQLQELENEST
ncbi:unnamed protein product, partial [Sphacelaria rigidula]